LFWILFVNVLLGDVLSPSGRSSIERVLSSIKDKFDVERIGLISILFWFNCGTRLTFPDFLLCGVRFIVEIMGGRDGDIVWLFGVPRGNVKRIGLLFNLNKTKEYLLIEMNICYSRFVWCSLLFEFEEIERLSDWFASKVFVGTDGLPNLILRRIAPTAAWGGGGWNEMKIKVFDFLKKIDNCLLHW
jgi:hypothetical protein